MCTDTIDYFLRNYGEVFSCMMDMTKAFDMVQQILLFIKIISIKQPGAVLSVILYCIDVIGLFETLWSRR